MGRLKPAAATSPASSSLKHLSHPHPLLPLSLYNSYTPCSACKLRSTGLMYTCTPCNFTLHQSCASLSHILTHPAHGSCTLSLLTAAFYPSGKFICNACRRVGDSWNYHCSSCNYDLHITCASKPLIFRHPSHSSCDLRLTFKNPYVDHQGFSCNICSIPALDKQWVYHCNSCDFDVHLHCTNTAPQHGHPPPPKPPLYHSQSHLMQHSVSSSTPVVAPPHQVNSFVRPSPQPRPQPQNQPHLMHGARPYAGNVYQRPYGYEGMAGNNSLLGENFMMAAGQGFVEGIFQGTGQAVANGVISGGGDGGDGDDDGGDDVDMS